jgi:hypothetical protein
MIRDSKLWTAESERSLPVAKRTECGKDAAKAAQAE